MIKCKKGTNSLAHSFPLLGDRDSYLSLFHKSTTKGPQTGMFSWVLMQFREPTAQNWTSTQLQNRGAVATGSGSFSLKRCEIRSFCGRVVARLGPGRYRSSVLMYLS